MGQFMRRDNHATAARKPEARSRVSNGKTLFLPGTDGRSGPARRFRDIVAEITSDLGGDDCLSEAQRQLIRRVAFLAVRCEQDESAMAAGEPSELGAYTTAANALRRIVATLGLRREPRDITPHLKDYIAGQAGDAGP